MILDRKGSVTKKWDLNMGITLIILVTLFSVIGFSLSLWLIFEEHGEAGWKSLVPGYNVYVLHKISGVETSKLWQWFVPGLNLYLFHQVNLGLTEHYHLPKNYAYGLTFFFWAFYPLVGVSAIDELENPSYQSFCGPLQFFGPAKFYAESYEIKKAA